MKTLKCDLCDFEAKGETFKDWMEALKPHYFEAHRDVMNDPTKTKEDMDKWMKVNMERFESSAVLESN
ncbi:MAG: hypothetical protein WAX44_03880 [Minisyncoccia bacterium]